MRGMTIAAALILGAGIVSGGLSTGAIAAATKHDEVLKLSPDEQVEQRCNARAMGLISREHSDMRPDELVAYAFADTVIKDNAIRAPGAAVRSRDKWYRLSYYCVTSEDHTEVERFDYSLGEPIPERQWEDHYLVH